MESCKCAVPLRAEIDDDLFGSRRLRSDSRALGSLAGPEGRPIKNREGDAEAKRIILNVRRETIQAAQARPVYLRARSSRIR